MQQHPGVFHLKSIYLVVVPSAGGYLRAARYQGFDKRFADAVNANRKVIALSGETAQRQADLGEALTASANGIVTVEAKTAFERAVALDKSEPKARFFIGVAAEQDGDKTKAAAIWRDMLAQAPPGAPWAATVQQALASIGEAAPAPPLAAAPPGPNAARC